MENKESENLFRKVHQAVQKRKERIREAQQADSELRLERANEEAKRGGLDRA
jgi:hypothetical protein